MCIRDRDISVRTSGDIYIGVVGPVRAGKSTFIKRFMETQVIPNIDNVYRRERAKDELPQSGSGRMVMTAEMCIRDRCVGVAVRCTCLSANLASKVIFIAQTACRTSVDDTL